MTSPAMQQEWRQFRILAHDSVRKLLNSAMLARDGDPIQFAIWTTALVSTPPALYAFGQVFRYAALRTAPPGVIERILLTDRMFFVVYSLIAAALLAALIWDALYPDRDEQEIIGALPVRARTATAARLCAAMGVAVAFAVAINLPSAAFFSLVSVSHPIAGLLPVVFVAHLVSTVTGCVTVFAMLLVVRGMASIALGSSVTDRLATGLQLVTIVALVEVFFYLPAILPVLVHAMTAGGATAMWMPPTWFGAIYSELAGPRHPVYVSGALRGLAILAAVLAAVVPLYVWPAPMMARRALESQPGGRRQAWVTSAVRRTAAGLAGPPPGGSIARFALISLARSRRHALLVVSYAGVGVAFAMVQVIASGLRGGVHLEIPGRALLAAPLILMFFVVTGIRAAFKVPRDLDANWIFRLHRPTTGEAGAGTRSALFLAGVLPIVLLTGIGSQAAGWSWQHAARVVAIDVLAGALLVECLLYGWTTIPFACARPASQEAMQTRWLAAIVPFIAFAYGVANLQVVGLRSLRVALGVGAWLALAALTVNRLRRRRADREAIPFDGPAGHLEVLNLSEANQ